jgi:hypothetical protein
MTSIEDLITTCWQLPKYRIINQPQIGSMKNSRMQNPLGPCENEIDLRDEQRNAEPEM